jgi:hypothetical protein
MRKSIPAPVDQVGRTISFRPTPSSDILIGDVVKVWVEPGPDPRYPKGSQGYKNGIRALFTKIRVELPDGRLLNMPCEQEDVAKYRMVAENQLTDHW